MKAYPPTPSIDQVAALCAEEYDLTGNISRLVGENDNYQIVTPDNRRHG